MRREEDSNRLTYLGTCFRFASASICLTAAHCVSNEDAPRLQILFPDLGGDAEVARIRLHWTYDVAILYLGHPSGGGALPSGEAFENCTSSLRWGDEFGVIGFPSETIGTSQAPTFRMLVGHIQRYFQFRPPNYGGCTVAEMSVPAPAGLSGAPVYLRSDPRLVIGVVVGNNYAYTIEDSVEEETGGSGVYRIEARRFVSYGVAILLNPLAFWLRWAIPSAGTAAVIGSGGPTRLDILPIIAGIVERGGSRFRACFQNPDTKELCVDVYSADQLVRAAEEQLRELSLSIGMELKLRYLFSA